MTFDPSPNCPHCGQALVTAGELWAAAAIVSLSKAAGAPRIAEHLEYEAIRRTPQDERADAPDDIEDD